MGEQAYDHSGSSSGMSPSTPPVHQHRGPSRSRHATVPRGPTATTRPAIKIIHIIAPEIIKTDVDNFRDLVQRLTGRHQPADDDSSKAATSPVEEKPQPQKKRQLADDSVARQENRGRKKIKCEVVKVEEGEYGCGGGGDLDFTDLWLDLNPGGFLSLLEEDLFQGMMAPDLAPMATSRMDLVGEMCASYLA